MWKPEMWQPNAIQVPTDFVQAVLSKRVPPESLIALVAFLHNRPTSPKTIVETFGLNRDAAIIAWKYLESGRIDTSDGKTSTPPTPSESAPVVENPSTPTEDLAEWCVGRLIQMFPTAPAPNYRPDMMDEIRTALKGDKEFANDILIVLEQSEPRIPAGLFMHLIRSMTPEQIRASAATIKKSPKRRATNILDEMFQRAEERVMSLPQPGATEEEVERTRALNHRMEDTDGAE